MKNYSLEIKIVKTVIAILGIVALVSFALGEVAHSAKLIKTSIVEIANAETVAQTTRRLSNQYAPECKKNIPAYLCEYYSYYWRIKQFSKIHPNEAIF